MTILAIDFMNACHRARSGFKLGPAPVVFNFFRQFRSLVGQFEPTQIYVALEGRPRARHELHSEYKANRTVEPDDPRANELLEFFKQVNVIKDLLTQYFPVSVIRHPHHEADDTIANIIRNSTSSDDWIVISSDTDFIQLIQENNNVRIYNPVTKKFVEAPSDYSYVIWKALRGDPTDNIPGIPGCGDKTAAKLAEAVDTDEFKNYLLQEDHAKIFEKNIELIQFAEWTNEETLEMTCSIPSQNWNSIKTVFEGYGFSSMVKSGSWEKFVNTFKLLFNN